MTKAKQSTKAGPGNLGEAIAEVFRKADIHRAATPAPLLAAIDELRNDLAGLDLTDETVRRAPEAGQHRKRSQVGENHGKAALPKAAIVSFGPASDRTVEVAESLLLQLAQLWEIPRAPVKGPPDHYPPPALLYSVVRRLMSEARPRHASMCTRTEALERAYEGLTGHKYGELSWWEEPLAKQLEMNERHRREAELQAVDDRKRARRGEPRTRKLEVHLLGDRLRPDGKPVGALDRYVAGDEIMLFMRRIAGDRELPTALTASAIDGMIARTGLGARGGGRGGGRKPSATVVSEWKATLRNSTG